MNKVRQENYQGKSRFVFGGKYILGSSSDNIALVAAYGGLTIGLTVYGFTLAKYMYYTIGPILPILSYIVAAVGMYHLFRTTFTDPGIIPRGNFETAEEAMQSVVSTDPESGEMNIPLVKLDESGDSHSERILEGQAPTKQNPDLAFYKHRYCHTCKIMRPPKASHCNDCDNCVIGFDHHCFFMGNCIGRRNHKHFFLFLLGASVFCAISTIVGVCGFYSIASQHPQVFVNIRERSNYWIISASLGFVSMVFCNRRHCSSAKNTLLGIAMITFIIGFFLVSDGIEVPYYESPVSFVGYVAAQSPFALWIISNFLGTFWSISRGMTYKEKHTIKKEVLDADRKRAMFKLTWKEKIANVREFLNREQIESQVHGVV